MMNNNNSKECCICYETECDIVLLHKCSHNLCINCLLKLQNKRCPLCREPINIINNVEYDALPSLPQPQQQMIVPNNTPILPSEMPDFEYITPDRERSLFDFSPEDMRELEYEYSAEYATLWKDYLSKMRGPSPSEN